MSATRAKQLPPHAVLSGLRCAQCSELLSCDPVRILPNGDVRCGRCSRDLLATAQAVRSAAFEDAASYFAFPCRYGKCNRLLERQEVLPHETQCDFGRAGCCACWRRCGADNYPPPKPKGMYHVTADDRTHELITCAHCFGYASAAPIFIRPNGTYVCYRCGPDLQAPPVLRDSALEALLHCFVVKCSYRLNGCGERYRFGEEIMEHEADCNYNPQKRLHHEPPPMQPRGSSAGGHQKVKGVIATIASGHIYATITPNHFNQYQKYGPHPDERLTARASSECVGMSAAHAHRWDACAGAGGPKRSEGEEENDARRHMRTAQITGIGVTRNESMLYNSVVSEMKSKQNTRKMPAPTHG